MTTGTYAFVSLIVKIILLELALSLSALVIPSTDETQCVVHLSFNSTNTINQGYFKRYLNVV